MNREGLQQVQLLTLYIVRNIKSPSECVLRKLLGPQFDARSAIDDASSPAKHASACSLVVTQTNARVALLHVRHSHCIFHSSVLTPTTDFCNDIITNVTTTHSEKSFFEITIYWWYILRESDVMAEFSAQAGQDSYNAGERCEVICLARYKQLINNKLLGSRQWVCS